MGEQNNNADGNRQMVIFLGTSSDDLAARQEVGSRIAETFKIPLAKVLAAMMRAPFPVSRGQTLEAANDLVQTLRNLGANAVVDSEGEWPSETRILLNLQGSLPEKAPSSTTAEGDPSVAARTGKSGPASTPAVAPDRKRAEEPAAGAGEVFPAMQIVRKLGSSDDTGSESSGP